MNPSDGKQVTTPFPIRRLSPLPQRRERVRARTLSLSHEYAGEGTKRRARVSFFGITLLAIASFFAGSPARAQTPATPPALQGVGITQKLGTTLPLDLSFRDERGNAVHLGDYFHGKPVVFTLVYFQCPMLCNLTLNQLTRSFNGMTMTAGKDFQVLAVSFNPKETPELAMAKKNNYLRAYRRENADPGWHFLTGDQPAIDAITKAAGFKFKWDEAQQSYAHASAVMVVAPDGTLSRYFLGVDYPPTELSEAIAQAARGRVGPPAEAVYFYCFKYDPATGKYGLIISRALHVLGALAILAIGGLIFVLIRISKKRSAIVTPQP